MKGNAKDQYRLPKDRVPMMKEAIEQTREYRVLEILYGTAAMRVHGFEALKRDLTGKREEG